MASARLKRLRPSRSKAHGWQRARFILLLAAATVVASLAQACGPPFEEAPPTLPYYSDLLPAKGAGAIFLETYAGPKNFRTLDLDGALTELSDHCLAGDQAPALLAVTNELLAQARLDPGEPAALCNALNDAHDLFAAATPAVGQAAAGYLRWRVDHAKWFVRPRDPSRNYIPGTQSEDLRGGQSWTSALLIRPRHRWPPTGYTCAALSISRKAARITSSKSLTGFPPIPGPRLRASC